MTTHRLPTNVYWRSLFLSERVDWIRHRNARRAVRGESSPDRDADTVSAILDAQAYKHWLSWHRVHGVRPAERDVAARRNPPCARPRTSPPVWELFALAVLTRLDADDRDDTRARTLETLVRPFVVEALSRIRARVVDLAGGTALPVTEGFFDDLAQGLQLRLFGVASSALILEVNVLRLRGTLQGQTPEQRFEHFINYMRSSKRLRRFFLTYPVLLRALSTIALNCVESVTWILGLYCRDYADICGLVGHPDPGRVTQFQFAGDAHDAGRCVTVIRCESGVSVVFKPRSLARDAAFQRLTEWVNRRGFQPHLSSLLRIVSREDYGWCAFVSPAGATNREAIQRYYSRLGGLLALLRSIRGSDIHFENIIASGEEVCIVDLEMLLCNRLNDTGSGQTDSPVNRLVQESVFDVGILPFQTKSADSPDFSALGKNADTSIVSPLLADPNRDCVRVEMGPLRLGHTSNLPELDGNEVTVVGFERDLLAGFERMYRLLCDCRHELVDPKGPLADLVQSESRVILAATRFYGRIQRHSWHTDYLRDGLAHEAFVVTALFSLPRRRRQRARLVKAEFEAIVTGDLPKFSSMPLSREIWATNSRPRQYFDADSWATCRARIESMGATDFRLQTKFIGLSLALLNPNGVLSATASSAPGMVEADTGTATTHRSTSRHDRLRATEPSDVGLLEEAYAIGQRICDQACIERGVADWISPVVMPDDSRQVRIGPAGPDLYQGVAGIALFLAHLARVTATPRFEDVANAAIEFCRRRLAAVRASQNSRTPWGVSGAFGGASSNAHGLLRCGLVLNRRELIDECLESVIAEMRSATVSLADRRENMSEAVDMIGGAAGLVQVGLLFAETTGSTEALTLATELGWRILARTEKSTAGYGWPNAISPGNPLTGMAHGNAGIAWSLQLLSAATGETRFAACAREAIQYERSKFLPDSCAWPDIRGDAGSSTGKTPMSWCWGAPGVGIARLALPDESLNTEDLSEIDLLVTRSLGDPLSWSDCLCHGELGNVELPLLASQRFGRDEWRVAATKRACMVLERRHKNGEWLDGVGNIVGMAAPGFMLGLAGIGFQLLRLSAPDLVPSVLALAGPYSPPVAATGLRDGVIKEGNIYVSHL